MEKNLFDQMGDAQRRALGLMVGVDQEGASFRNYLREVAPLPEGFTIGDAARAYLVARLAALQ